jgi:hypothetical protein
VAGYEPATAAKTCNSDQAILLDCAASPGSHAITDIALTSCNPMRARMKVGRFEIGLAKFLFDFATKLVGTFVAI